MKRTSMIVVAILAIITLVTFTAKSVGLLEPINKLVGATGAATCSESVTFTAATWNGAVIPVAYGGTGAATSAAARTALGSPSVYTGTLVTMPVTTAKVKGDIFVADNGAVYICKSIGADTTGWAVVTN